MTKINIEDESLIKTEGIFEKAFKQSSIPMGITNIKDGHFIEVSDAFLDLTGLNRDEIAASTSIGIGIITPDKRSFVLNELQTKGKVENLEIQVTQEGGECRDGLLNIFKISVGYEEYLVTIFTDITARKYAEKRLQQNEAKYRLLTENMNDIVGIMDLNLKLIFISPSIEKIAGFTPEECMLLDPTEMMTPESLAHVAEVMSEELKREQIEGVDSQRTTKLELEYYHKNGSTVWMETVASFIRDDTGKIIGIHGVSRDIRDRRRAESALKESEKRFRSLIQKSLDIIIILDGNGFMIYETPSLEYILGYQPGYLIGKLPFEFIHSADLERVANDLNEVYLKTNPGIPTEFRFRKADGTWVYLEAIGQNLLEDPTIKGIVITARDITERKHAEEELKKHRDHLEDLVKERTTKLVKAIEQMEKQIEERKRAEDALRVNEEIFRIHFSLSNDVMFTNDEEFRVLSVTPNVERVLGYKPKELIGKSFQELDVLHPDDMGKAADNAKHVLSGGASRHPIYRFITQDGKTKFGEVSGVPLIKKGQRTTLISVARDVTERIEKEQVLMETMERYRTHFTLTDDVMFTFDHKLRFNSISPNVEKVTGYKPEELLGKPAHKLGVFPLNISMMLMMKLCIYSQGRQSILPSMSL